MNIFGIGIDIIEIDRIENAIKKNPRFLERNFTEKEVLFYVERMMENTSKLATCPFELTREDIEKIYRESIVVE